MLWLMLCYTFCRRLHAPQHLERCRRGPLGSGLATLLTGSSTSIGWCTLHTVLLLHCTFAADGMA
jgi:hypothetical protein